MYIGIDLFFTITEFLQTHTIHVAFLQFSEPSVHQRDHHQQRSQLKLFVQSFFDHIFFKHQRVLEQALVDFGWRDQVSPF